MTAPSAISCSVTGPRSMPPEPGDEWVGSREEVAALIPQLFEVAKIAFGEKEARRLYQAMLARGRGRPKGSTRAQKDEYLLTLYDMHLLAILRWEAAQPRPRPYRVTDRKIEQVTRYIATRLDRNHPGEYGNSVKAIETQLRRKREQREARQPPRPGLINSAPPRD
jgi:hypothetical protein